MKDDDSRRKSVSFIIAHIRFPTNKKTILEFVKRNRMSEEVVKKVEDIPDTFYNTPNEFLNEWFGDDEQDSQL